MLLLAPFVSADAWETVPCDDDGCATDDDEGCSGIVAVGCTYEYHHNCQYNGSTDHVECQRVTTSCVVSVAEQCAYHGDITP